MATREHTSATCPIDPAAPVFFILADGIKRFEDRAGNLYWGDEIPEARIISYEHAEDPQPTRWDEWGGWAA
jgi:hypothetical protein